MFARISPHASMALLLGTAIAIALVAGWRSLAGTTLRAPWYWAFAAAVLVSGVEIIVALLPTAAGNADWIAALRYSVAVATFLPMMAVLGAKRPQDRGWQFIVASLWMILCLPSGQYWFLGGGRALMVHPAWSWFLAIMILVQCGNYLPTRYWPSSLLFAAAQTVLLWDWLPGIVNESNGALPAEGARPLIALSLAALAGWLVMFGIPRGRRPGGRRPSGRRMNEPLDRVWRDFRDQFGAAWALRVLERINATARLSDWPLVLTWSGFRNELPERPEISSQVRVGVEDALQTLLRRFVSPQWISRRIVDEAKL